MSNLIRREEHPELEIQVFQAEEIESSEKARMKATEGGGYDDSGQPLTEAEKRQRLSTIEMEAYEKGFEQGQKDGLALGQKRIDEIAKRMENLITELSKLKEQIYKEAEQEILALSLEIARKIVKREVTTSPEIILNSIREAARFLTERTKLKIFLNPDDLETVKENIAELGVKNKIENIEIVEDVSINKGGCILETGFGKINATIEDQFEAIKNALVEKLSKSGEVSDGPTP